MINEVIRLVKPGVFIPAFDGYKLPKDQIVVQPRFLSICEADLRYFFGRRPKNILKEKLPLALFHEAVGKVVFDPNDNLPKGSYCVLLPCGIDKNDNVSNYRTGALFRSSNADGFSQELMFLHNEEIIPIPADEDPKIFVLTELLSVCCHALKRAMAVKNKDVNSISIWGDGVMSYMMAFAAHHLYKDVEISVYGKHDAKLELFSFIKRKINIYDNITENYSCDIAIECVGGDSASSAINSAIQHLTPCGILVLTGVSENFQNIKTRSILEKGILLIGSSRSRQEDFLDAYKLISGLKSKGELRRIIEQEVETFNYNDLREVFNSMSNKKRKIIIDFKI